MLIVAASHSEQIKTFTNTSQPISSEQQTLNDFTITELLDNRRAELPKMINGEEDSVLVGEALDLSSKDKVLKPIPMDDEYTETPGPLPAYYVLNHEGMLCGWWVVYDKAIREGQNYPGLVTLQSIPQQSNATPKASEPSKTSSTPANPAATSGVSSTFGSPAFSTASSTPAKPTFGAPSFGATGFSAATPTLNKPTFGAPSFGTPSFGSASQPGAGGFGAGGGLGKTQSAWGSGLPSSKSTQPNPFSAQADKPSGFAKFGAPSSSSTITQPNPFSAQSTSSEGFAKFGTKGGTFGGVTSSSPFGGLSGQKSVFGTSQPTALSKESSAVKSFGSTLSVGSSFGDGSTLPSWANTPAGNGGSIFGHGTSASFASSKDSDLSSDADKQNRERDESTPTPQAPPQQPKGLFGLPSNVFKLSPSFKGDGSAKYDLPKPATTPGGSLFSNDFASTLPGISSKTPATPIKKEEQGVNLRDISTTPATMPKPTFSSQFSKPSETKPSETKPTKPVGKKESPVVEDAPLPPDFTTWKPRKNPDDDLPPLAGSPGVKVEAPSSDDIPSSPLEDRTDNEQDDLSVEEEEGADEDVSQPSSDDDQKGGQKTPWFQHANATSSPRIRPAAPTPPAMPSGAPSPALFGQVSKPSSASLFQTSATPAGLSKPIFPAPSNRRHENLRSPSPVRSASTSALFARRQPPFSQGGTLSSSVQQAVTPPTAEPGLSDLCDEEDERIRQELAVEPEAKATLDAFIAHSDYAGTVTKSGTAAQIEIMYRDMNSMVDTVGLNARSLKAFVAHHTGRQEVTRLDLDEIIEQGVDGPLFDKWSLAQIEDLKALEHDLEQELDAGRIQGVVNKLSQLSRLLHDKAKLMTKLNDIRRQIINRKDPERQEALLKASLPKELAEQQKALRNEYAQLLSLLGKAEEAAYLLKSKLASNNAVNGNAAAVPTVDAVKKTINTLIRMTERRNNDIVSLEAQLRKLNMESNRQNGTPSRSHGTPSRSFGTPPRPVRSIMRHSSPVATPPTNRSRMSLGELNRTVQTPEPDDTPSKGYGLYYTPDSSPTSNGANYLAKLADDLDAIDISELVEASQRRRQVAGALANAVRRRGVKVTKVT
jgi:nucleoporin NUP159